MKGTIAIAAVLVLGACSPDPPAEAEADPDGYYVTQVRAAIGDTAPYTYTDAMLLNAGYAECAPGESNEANGVLAAALVDHLSPEQVATLTRALEDPNGSVLVYEIDLMEYNGALPDFGETQANVMSAVRVEAANVLCPDAQVPDEIADGRLTAIAGVAQLLCTNPVRYGADLSAASGWCDPGQ